MLSLLGSVLGFGTSFLHSVLGFFEKKQANKKEKTVEENAPQNYVISLELLNKIVNVLGQLNYKAVFQLMEEIRSLRAVELNEDTKEAN